MRDDDDDGDDDDDDDDVMSAITGDTRTCKEADDAERSGEMCLTASEVRAIPSDAESGDLIATC
jgi:hypothetical protein